MNFLKHFFFLVLMAVILTACDKNEAQLVPIDDLALVGNDLLDQTLTTRSSRAGGYIGIGERNLNRYYCHVFQERVFSGWKNIENYILTPGGKQASDVKEKSKKHFYPRIPNIDELSFTIDQKGTNSCGIASYVIARALMYPDVFSWRMATDHSAASARKRNTVVFAETAMRFHLVTKQPRNSVKMLDIIRLANGTVNTPSDYQFLKNERNPENGVDLFINKKCDYDKAGYEKAFARALAAGSPFVTLTKIISRNHPIKNRRTLIENYSGTKKVGNYINNDGANHYIVVVGMDMVYDNKGDLDKTASTVYFLDSYWDAKVVWETSFQKIIENATGKTNKSTWYGYGFL